MGEKINRQGSMAKTATKNVKGCRYTLPLVYVVVLIYVLMSMTELHDFRSERIVQKMTRANKLPSKA